jgi:acyl-CoA synthetase (AMP-forming)/AMP-acid ligase II
MDENGNELKGNQVDGHLCIKFPWPSMARTIWGNHERYKETYFSTYKNKYFTGDGALRDSTGYYRITGRVDDVIIVSGHNLGTAPIEDAINEHPAVAESAIVGFPHDIKGNALYKQKSYDDALKNFEKSKELNPNYSRAYWGMGLAYSKLKNYDEMDNSFAAALELAQKQGDEKMATKISSTAQKKLQAEGASKLQASEWTSALKYLNASLKYGDADKDTYYYLALANNGNKNYDEALKATEKGLELSQAENQDYKAKYYYEMGNAYKGKGMNTEACGAYTDAAHGRFVESANYELTTVLKCN